MLSTQGQRQPFASRSPIRNQQGCVLQETTVLCHRLIERLDHSPDRAPRLESLIQRFVRPGLNEKPALGAASGVNSGVQEKLILSISVVLLSCARIQFTAAEASLSVDRGAKGQPSIALILPITSARMLQQIAWHPISDVATNQSLRRRRQPAPIMTLLQVIQVRS
jgi:hypothetical protein